VTARPEAIAEDLLRTGRVAHLATAGADGRPHVVPVVFAWLGGRIYTPVDRKRKRVADPKRLRRVRNLGENPRVAVVVDRWDEDWERLAYVLVEGEATLLESGPEWERAAGALLERYPQYRAQPIAGRPIIRVAVDRMTAWQAAR
jgi:PPOX class probable F420-dependent enzyme